MNSKQQYAEKIKKTLIDFSTELITCFPSETSFVLMNMYVSNINAVKISDGLKDNILKYSDKIEKRDDTFFLENAGTVFGGGKNSDRFKTLWPTIEDDDKKLIWEWVVAILRLVVNYNEL